LSYSPNPIPNLAKNYAKGKARTARALSGLSQIATIRLASSGKSVSVLRLRLHVLTRNPEHVIVLYVDYFCQHSPQ